VFRSVVQAVGVTVVVNCTHLLLQPTLLISNLDLI
jgi:hypothetical protein